MVLKSSLVALMKSDTVPKSVQSAFSLSLSLILNLKNKAYALYTAVS